MPDELGALVGRAREGDRRAFDELVRATTTDTYTLARRLTGTDEDARDVTQETYLRAFRSIHKFRGDARFTTWLYRITANCAATHMTRRARHRHEELHEDGPYPDQSPQRDPQIRSEVTEMREQVKAAVAELPPKLRAVVVLRDIYDLPHAAIAEELGITETAAKVRLHRARLQLRETLFPLPDEVEDRAVG